MRFLFEFVACCGSPMHRTPEPAVPPLEEERSLVPAAPAAASAAISVRRPSRKKQRTRSAEWRPSLGPISEDGATLPKESPRKDTAASPASDTKKRSTAKVRYRSYSDGYRSGASMPTMIPTFSPTPFMF